MSNSFESVEAAFMALSQPGSPEWAQAFSFLAAHPDTAQMMLDAFQDTLKEMGAEASGVGADGEAVYSLVDVARAMGIPEAELDQAMDASPDEKS
jgi:hypothetical protein